MTLLRYWKIVLALLCLVTVTGLAGGLIGHRIARHHIDERNNPENWNIHVAREFDRIVKPTPEQAPRIQAHLDKAVRELQSIRLETISRSTNVIWRLVSEVEQELTPDQRQAFQVMKPNPSDLNLEVLNVNTKHDPKP